MTKSKLKPRNPLVALARFKPAGAHGKSEKAKRKKENSELQKTIKSQGKTWLFFFCGKECQITK